MPERAKSSTESAGFRSLKVWHKAMSALEFIYQGTKAFPKDELYGLTSQLRRAACSVPMNIAEGYKRRKYQRDYLRFLRTAHGSEGEIETGIEIAKRLGYWSDDEAQQHMSRYEEVGRMLDGLIARIEQDVRNEAGQRGGRKQ